MLQLLALSVVSNEKLGRRARDGAEGNSDGAGAVTELLHERSEELLDQAMFEQLLELAVVAAETVEEQFRAKVDELGDRVGKLGRLFGLTTGTTQPIVESALVTGSPASTDGEQRRTLDRTRWRLLLALSSRMREDEERAAEQGMAQEMGMDSVPDISPNQESPGNAALRKAHAMHRRVIMEENARSRRN